MRLIGVLAGVAIPFALVGCAMEVEFDDPEYVDTNQEIVNGTINEGDPAVGFVWLGGGSCTATLVSPKVMTTARHCVYYDQQDGPPTTANLADMEVYFGTRAPLGPNGYVYGSGIAVTDYAYRQDADLAILTLAAPAPAAPIPLGTRELAQHVGEPVRITGFGLTATGANDSGIKREGLTQLEGVDSDGYFGQLMIIGRTGPGTANPNGAKTCNGDSGGPTFMTFGGVEYLVGVTSFGYSTVPNTPPNCESDTTLGGQVRIDQYLPWIQNYIAQNDPQPTPGTPPSPDETPDAPQNQDTPGTGESPDAPQDSAAPGDPENEAFTPLVGGCSTAPGHNDGMPWAVLLFAVSLFIGRRGRKASR